jgi:chromosome segregation ATPase
LDLIALAIDLLSIGVLVIAVFVGFRTVRAFRQSKQAVTESASILGIIVSSLTSRVEASESLVTDLRDNLRVVAGRSNHLESQQSDIRADYLQVLGYLQEILSNDRKLITELEHVKTELTSIQQAPIPTRSLTRSEARPLPVPAESVVAALTPTEHQVLEILRREGPKAAPELGRRIRKSREHMARLMKKLYLDGYVDRESNRAPFRYKLNEKVGSILEHGEPSVTAAPSGKA